MAKNKTTSKKDVESLQSLIPEGESVSKEQLSAALEILEKQKNESIKAVLTNPSFMALSPETPSGSQQYSINRVRKSVKDLFMLFLTNQFVARAINVRADTLVSKGYNLVDGDETGLKACQELIDNSGGINLFKQLGVNTDIAGDGFLEKIYNIKKNKIVRLKHIHPLTFTFKRDKFNNIIIDDKTKEPVGFQQTYYDEQGVEHTKDVNKDIISHLRFNTLGDDFTGISTIQSGYSTILRLMNMEYSAAEAALRTANPLIVATASSKSPVQIAQWAQILGRITSREQIIIPEGMTLTMLSPGNQNFNEYAGYFLDAVVSTFGVPKSVLLGEGDNGNRAESIVLSRHFFAMIQGNQKYMEDFFNKIFKEYGELAGFSAPSLKFTDLAEDADMSTKSAMDLFSSGIITQNEARAIIGLESIPGGDSVGAPTSTTSAIGGVAGAIKKSDRAVQFPAEPGKVEGSQRGVKDKAKRNTFINLGNKNE